MRACACVNLVAAGALLLVLGFGGCGASAPAAATPASAAEPAPRPPADPEPAAPGKAGAAKGADSRSTESIRAVVVANRARARACYDQALEKLPDLSGDLTIRFTLDPKGKVRAAELNRQRSTIVAPELVECVAGVIRSLSFPPSARGMESTVNYPFNFEP
jgi:outer membrane biosynthesis protein TonB